MSDEQRAPAGWHLKKEIQVGHLISTIAIAVAAIVYVGDIKRDVEVLKAKVEVQTHNTAETISLLRDEVKEMSRKLDRLIEARAPR